MADLAAGDVAYTQIGLGKANPADPRFSGIFSLVFGDGALTYPAGGIPLTKAKLGCPANIDELQIMDAGSASGYVIKYDAANGKLRLYNSVGAHTHDVKIIGSQAAAGTDAVSAKTLTLGKEAATNITIAGANSGTLGGVVVNTATNGVELGNVAFAATTIRVKVVGF